jgi:hypothetical protein
VGVSRAAIPLLLECAVPRSILIRPLVTNYLQTPPECKGIPHIKLESVGTSLQFENKTRVRYSSTLRAKLDTG